MVLRRGLGLAAAGAAGVAGALIVSTSWPTVYGVSPTDLPPSLVTLVLNHCRARASYIPALVPCASIQSLTHSDTIWHCSRLVFAVVAIPMTPSDADDSPTPGSRDVFPKTPSIHGFH